MSTRNNLQNHSEITPTATVAIFTPDMRRILLVFNEKLMALVSPWGKQESTDKNIYHTWLREVWEEVGIDIPVTSWQWLDINWEIVTHQTIVQEYQFEFWGKNFLDHLFFYRLSGEHREIYEAEKRGEWYSKKTLQPKTILLDGRAYRELVPGTREAVLDIMKGPI